MLFLTRAGYSILLLVPAFYLSCVPLDDPLPHFYMSGANPTGGEVGIVLDRPDVVECVEYVDDGAVREARAGGDGRWTRDGLRIVLESATGCDAWFPGLECEYWREGWMFPVDVLHCRDMRGRKWWFYRELVRL